MTEPKRFFVEPKRRSAGVLKGEVKEQAQIFLDQGKSVPEVAKIVKVKARYITQSNP